MKKRNKIIYSVLLIAAAVTVLILVDNNIIGNAYVKRILNLSAIYAIVSVSMNLVNGFTGLFSLGQAGFMAIGAFTVAVFTVPVELRSSIFYIKPMAPWLINIELPFFAALLLGGIISALAALIIGWPVLRLKSDYLAIATLGFSEIIRIIFTNTQSITNGALGINRIPGIKTMWLPFGVAAICIGIMLLLINSSYGRAFKAIREDEVAAEAMGINTTFYKVLAFAIGALFAGIAGALYGGYLSFITPESFGFMKSIDILVIVVFGGMGSITGSVVGAIAISFISIALQGIPELRMVIYSVILFIIMVYRPQGIMGNYEFKLFRKGGTKNASVKG